MLKELIHLATYVYMHIIKHILGECTLIISMICTHSAFFHVQFNTYYAATFKHSCSVLLQSAKHLNLHDPAAPDESPGDSQSNLCWIYQIPAICHWQHEPPILKFCDIPWVSECQRSLRSRIELWKRADRRASRPASEVQFSSPPGCSLAPKRMPLQQLTSPKVMVHEIRSHSSRLKTQRPQLHRKRFSCRSLSPWRTSLPAMRQPTKLRNLSVSLPLPTWKYQTFLTNLAGNLANQMADRVANKVASCVATKGDCTSLDWLWAI